MVAGARNRRDRLASSWCFVTGDPPGYWTSYVRGAGRPPSKDEIAAAIEAKRMEEYAEGEARRALQPRKYEHLSEHAEEARKMIVAARPHVAPLIWKACRGCNRAVELRSDAPAFCSTCRPT